VFGAVPLHEAASRHLQNGLERTERSIFLSVAARTRVNILFRGKGDEEAEVPWLSGKSLFAEHRFVVCP
jgi:hypothetical protein